MRIVRPEPELNSWQKAGWTYRPRNSHEWKMLKAGRKQPAERDKPWPKPYKCYIHGVGVPYKVVSNGDKRARRCIKCGLKRGQTWYSKNVERMKKVRKASKKRARKSVPYFEDGYASVSATWLVHNLSPLQEYLKEGNVVVEMFGDPVFVITTLEKGRKL